MATAFFKNVTMDSSNNTFSGELTNSNGNREIDFENEQITKPDGSVVTNIGDCEKFGCVQYSPGNSGKATDMILQASVTMMGTVTENDTKVAIRNLAMKISQGDDDITVTISKKK